MNSRVLRSLVAITAVVASVAGAWATAPATAAPLAQANILTNGDMESFAGNGVANSWDPWWETVPNPANGKLDYVLQPNWVPETNKFFVQSGSSSQHIGHNWDPWHAGIRQTISVAPGSTAHFTAYGRVFASTPDFPAPSDSAVQSRMQIGAEPNGSIDWASGTVQWGPQGNPHNTWGLFTLDVTAGDTGKITLFLSANFRGDSRYHLDVWWDNVSAIVTNAGGGPGPTPTSGNLPPTNAPPAPTAFKTPTPGADGNIIYVVQLGDTLYRIAGITGVTVDQIRSLNGLTSDILSVGQRLIIVQGASKPAATKTATAAGTAGASATAAITSTEATQAAASATSTLTATAAGPDATQVAQQTAAAGVGTVCALLWNDKNGDGVRDGTEGLLPGGQIAVVEITTGKPVQAYTTDGVSEPHCFNHLPAGQYTVSFAAPAGYNATTATSAPIDVAVGSTSTLEFGAQASAAIANQPAPRPSSSALLTALLLAGGVVFLLLAAGVGAFLFMRRPG